MHRKAEIELALIESRVKSGLHEAEARELVRPLLKLHSDLCDRLEESLPPEDQIRAAALVFLFYPVDGQENLFAGWLVVTDSEIVYCANELSDQPQTGFFELRFPRIGIHSFHYQVLAEDERTAHPETEHLKIRVVVNQQTLVFFAPEDYEPDASLLSTSINRDSIAGGNGTGLHR